MDWADDVAYSVHDVEDGVISGRIDLRVLADEDAAAALGRLGEPRMGGGCPPTIWCCRRPAVALPVVAAVGKYDATLAASAAFKRLTSELVGRFASAAIAATRAVAGTAAGPVSTPICGCPRWCGRRSRCSRCWRCSSSCPTRAHLALQARQRERIHRWREWLLAGAPATLDPLFAPAFTAAADDGGGCGWWSTRSRPTPRAGWSGWSGSAIRVP